MGNAHEETKKHADFVSKPVHEDGIMYALTELGLI
ncbi:MAG: HAD hydrolase family protein [Turicibacter sp.]